MKFLSLLLVGFTVSGCLSGNKDPKIYLVKQWHLTANQNTLDIKKSMGLPQYTNQMAIYLDMKKRIEAGTVKAIISEGCEGEINDSFSKNFNGWTIGALKERVGKKEFQNILAPVPMKLKAEFPKLKVLCGDDEALIKKNLLAFSDARGFAGFYQRIMQYQNDPVKLETYKKQLESLTPGVEIKDPIAYTRKKALAAIDLFQKYIRERNEAFIKVAMENKNLNPAIIIGGLHVPDLERRLGKIGEKYETLLLAGYSDNEAALIAKLKEFIKGTKSEITLFQVPGGFNSKNFPIGNLLDEKDVFTPAELREIKALRRKHGISKKLLLSDYDKDGIRDFTLSSSGSLVVLAAEDRDWDNDGKENLIDDTVGETKVTEELPKLSLMNSYQSQKSSDEVINAINKHMIHVVGDYGSDHELLVLEVFSLLLEKKFFKHWIKYIKATKPKFTYGKDVFFTYVKSTNTLEYYPDRLLAYINENHRKRFKGVDIKKLTTQFTIPVIIHSMAHEMAHSLNFDVKKAAMKAGWTWTETPYTGKYLKDNRDKVNKILTIKENVKYKNRSFKEWLNLYKAFNIKKGSFLVQEGIPSIYAMKSPEEWFAEEAASCVYKKVFKGSETKKRSAELDLLLGFNPSSSSKAFCQSVLNLP